MWILFLSFAFEHRNIFCIHIYKNTNAFLGHLSFRKENPKARNELCTEFSTAAKRKGKSGFVVEKVQRQRKIIARPLDLSVLVTRAKKGRRKGRKKVKKVR